MTLFKTNQQNKKTENTHECGGTQTRLRKLRIRRSGRRPTSDTRACRSPSGHAHTHKYIHIHHNQNRRRQTKFSKRTCSVGRMRSEPYLMYAQTTADNCEQTRQSLSASLWHISVYVTTRTGKSIDSFGFSTCRHSVSTPNPSITDKRNSIGSKESSSCTHLFSSLRSSLSATLI